MKIFSSVCLMVCVLAFSFGCKNNCKTQSIKVLIFSGSNNHDWQSNSAFLKNMYHQTGLFEVQVTERPDTLDLQHLQQFDVLVSNWNSWPANDLRWPKELEVALLNFIEEGGGFVTFHASTSAFYQWPEFKDISVAAWADSTWHGKNSRTKVVFYQVEHPVTSGINDFYIFDELWVNAEENLSFTVLASATNSDISEKKIENQPAVFVKEYGKGRIFHTLLGHDTRTMRNKGFQTVLLRGTEWAARGNVTKKIPQELKNDQKFEDHHFWAQTDTSFSLLNNSELVWQYNFRGTHSKPFFHPVYLGKNNITCLSPEDHRWHLGQWFSWKFINGVNYWEYQNGTYRSEGITEIKNIKLVKNDDFSAEIHLDIVYHPTNGDEVLEEKREIKVSPPLRDGSIAMDYSFDFTALADSVELNRTPILGEAEGQSWGGYAGLSIRFSQSFMEPFFISSWGENTQINGKTGDWLYFGFKGLDENTPGSQMMIHPSTIKEGASWYSVSTEDHPFYYFSPAVIYRKPILLLKNEKLKLKYRVKHYSGEKNLSELEKEFQQYKLNH